MGAGHEQNVVMERACEDLTGQVPVSLADDIGCAARSDVPVLITGGPEQGREIACAIDRKRPVRQWVGSSASCRPAAWERSAGSCVPARPG